MDIINVRSYMEKWGSYTYEQGVDFCKGYKADKIEQCKRLLSELNILNCKMDGSSVERLPNTEEGSLHGVKMSEVFSKTVKKYLTPASYIINLMVEYNEIAVGYEINSGILARGLRTLPSFIREMDLAYKLQNINGAMCYRGSVDDDITGHTDVFMNYHGETYRIWSYLCTSDRARRNTIAKLRGDRGKLPNGEYLLCPLDIFDDDQCETISGWKLYGPQYVDKVQDILNNGRELDYERYFINSDFENINEYIKNIVKIKKQ